MPCYEKCVNRGKPYELSQENYCDHCSRGQTWKQDHYNEGRLVGLPVRSVTDALGDCPLSMDCIGMDHVPSWHVLRIGIANI